VHVYEHHARHRDPSQQRGATDDAGRDEQAPPAVLGPTTTRLFRAWSLRRWPSRGFLRRCGCGRARLRVRWTRGIRLDCQVGTCR
jgi:hypothetical protein